MVGGGGKGKKPRTMCVNLQTGRVVELLRCAFHFYTTAAHTFAQYKSRESALNTQTPARKSRILLPKSSLALAAMRPYCLRWKTTRRAAVNVRARGKLCAPLKL